MSSLALFKSFRALKIKLPSDYAKFWEDFVAISSTYLLIRKVASTAFLTSQPLLRQFLVKLKCRDLRRRNYCKTFGTEVIFQKIVYPNLYRTFSA